VQYQKTMLPPSILEVLHFQILDETFGKKMDTRK